MKIMFKRAMTQVLLAGGFVVSVTLSSCVNVEANKAAYFAAVAPSAVVAAGWKHSSLVNRAGAMLAGFAVVGSFPNERAGEPEILAAVDEVLGRFPGFRYQGTAAGGLLDSTTHHFMPTNAQLIDHAARSNAPASVGINVLPAGAISPNLAVAIQTGDVTIGMKFVSRDGAFVTYSAQSNNRAASRLENARAATQHILQQYAADQARLRRR